MLQIKYFYFCCFWMKGVASLLRYRPVVAFVPWSQKLCWYFDLESWLFIVECQSDIWASIGLAGFSGPGVDNQLLFEARPWQVSCRLKPAYRKLVGEAQSAWERWKVFERDHLHRPGLVARGVWKPKKYNGSSIHRLLSDWKGTEIRGRWRIIYWHMIKLLRGCKNPRKMIDHLLTSC